MPAPSKGEFIKRGWDEAHQEVMSPPFTGSAGALPALSAQREQRVPATNL